MKDEMWRTENGLVFDQGNEGQFVKYRARYCPLSPKITDFSKTKQNGPSQRRATLNHQNLSTISPAVNCILINLFQTSLIPNPWRSRNRNLTVLNRYLRLNNILSPIK